MSGQERSRVETERSELDIASTLAIDALDAVRNGQSVDELLDRLAALPEDDLAPVRTNRPIGLAFWLNLYNAGAQHLLEERPDLFASRWRFFRAPAVTVAGVELSLDDIEHGLLRGGRSKYGLGYLPRIARTGLRSDYRLALDPRVHFALNCGAASCPAIRVYQPDRVDDQLDQATATHLRETVGEPPYGDRIHVPRFCLWYIGDFGGYGGLRSFVSEHIDLPAGTTVSIRFAGHDWTKVPGQFSKE